MTKNYSILDSLNEFEPVIKKGALLNAGTIDNYNSMTIGWLTYGVLWSKKVVIVYVKHERYTHQFMDNNEFFTISLFNNEFKDAIAYFGTHSGRCVNKAKESGLSAIKYDEFSITYKEAYETIKLKKIYQDDLSKILPDEIIKKYYTIDSRHTMYVGLLLD